MSKSACALRHNGPPCLYISISVHDRDRRSVLIRGSACMPGAAGSATTQWLHCQLQLISGLECLARPTVPPQAVGAVTFKIPDHGQRVLAHDLQDNDCMWTGESEISNDADKLERMFPIEHHNGVVSDRSTARRDKPDANNERTEIGSHGIMPLMRAH